MGSLLARVLRPLLSKRDVRILTVGLDAAGKTTMLYKMKLGEVVTTIPTIGFNVETVEYKNVNFTVWDVGGRGGLRALYRHYYQNTQGLIFCVDSNDKDRVPEARDELTKLLSADELRNAPVLIFANKQDLPTAMSTSELTEKLGLDALRDRKWCIPQPLEEDIQSSCFTSGDGIYEGLDWLTTAIGENEWRIMSSSASKAAPAAKKTVENATIAPSSEKQAVDA